MRKLILGIVILLKLQFFFGGTIPPELQKQIRDDKNSRPAGWIKPTADFTWKTYLVKFHVVSATGATSPIVSQVQVDACLANLNNYFLQARINFVSCSPANFINNSSYYRLSGGVQSIVNGQIVTTTPNNSQRDYLIANHNVANSINIYIVDDILQYTEDGFNVAGFTYLPLVNINFIAIDQYNCLNCTLPHEMGHFLGLLHTHEDSFGKENVDGTNCRTAGDLLCDTKADPGFIPAEPNTYTILGEATGVTGILMTINSFNPTELADPTLFQTKYYVSKCAWADWRLHTIINKDNYCSYNVYNTQPEIVYSNYVVNGRRDHIYVKQKSITVNSLEWREITFQYGEGKEFCDNINRSIINPNPPIPNFGGCAGCKYFGTEKDPKNQSYNPDVNNIMSYAGCNCVSKFTVEQISEMHYWSSKPVRTQYQNFANLNLTNQTITTGNPTYSQQNVTVSNVTIGGNANVLIDHCNTTTITNDFSVGVGATLEIK